MRASIPRYGENRACKDDESESSLALSRHRGESKHTKKILTALLELPLRILLAHSVSKLKLCEPTPRLSSELTGGIVGADPAGADRVGNSSGLGGVGAREEESDSSKIGESWPL